jgi:YHS domain-containing protein
VVTRAKWIAHQSYYQKEKDMKNVKMLFVVALLVGFAPVVSGQEATDADKEQIARDRLRTAVQKICPVSGNKLGEHGAPIKARIGKETVFLCCKACLQGKVDAEHWATIHANVASAQAKCPVMDKALPKNAKGTVVEGQMIFICCPPCAKKITANPKTYLQKVDQLYTASLKEKQPPK